MPLVADDIQTVGWPKLSVVQSEKWPPLDCLPR